MDLPAAVFEPIFLALKCDRDRREITLALVKAVLNANNDQPIRELGTKLLGQLGNLTREHNAATHTMWVTVMPTREVRPQPGLPQPKNLKADFKSQFSKLEKDLRTCSGNS